MQLLTCAYVTKPTLLPTLLPHFGYSSSLLAELFVFDSVNLVDSVDSGMAVFQPHEHAALVRRAFCLAQRNRVDELSKVMAQLEDAVDTNGIEIDINLDKLRCILDVAIVNDHPAVVCALMSGFYFQFAQWWCATTAFLTHLLRSVPSQNHAVARYLLDANARVDEPTLFGSHRKHRGAGVNPVIAKAASVHQLISPLLRAIADLTEAEFTLVSGTRSYWASVAVLLRCKAPVDKQIARGPTFERLTPLAIVLRRGKVEGEVEGAVEGAEHATAFLLRKMATRLLVAKARVDLLTPSDQTCLQALLKLT